MIPDSHERKVPPFSFDLLFRLAALSVILLCLQGVVSFFLARVFPALLPFCLAWSVASVVRPLGAILAKRLKLPVRMVSCILTLLLFFGLAGGLILLLSALFREASELLCSLILSPDFPGTVPDGILRLFPGGLGDGEVAALVKHGLGSALSAITGAAGTVLSRVPSFVIGTVVTGVAAIYFSLDLPKVNAGILSLLPPAWRDRLRAVRDGTFRGIGGLIRAYGILFAITFALLLLGFLILGVGYAILAAFLVALFDLLPILGAGGILIPWGIFALLSGDTPFGIGLLVLSFLITAVRQFVEPRLLGRTFGLPPLLTLFSFYLGGKTAGLAGMIFAPCLAMLLFGKIKGRREKSG